MPRPRTLVAIVVSLVLCAVFAFLLWQRFGAADPTLPIAGAENARFVDPVLEAVKLQRQGLPFDPLAPAAKTNAPSPVPTIKLAAKALDFAFDHESRSLVALEPNLGAIRVYPSEYLDGTSTVVPAPIKVGLQPRSFLLKRVGGHRMVVVSLADETVAILDLDDKNTVARVVSPDLKNLTGLAADETPDTHVYYSGTMDNTSQGRTNQLIGRIDLTTLTSEVLARGSTGNGLRSLVGMSTDGRFLYTLDNNQGSGGTVMALAMDDLSRGGSRGVIRPIPRGRDQVSTPSNITDIVRDPHGRFVADSQVGAQGYLPESSQVYSPDLTRVMGKSPFPPLVVFRNRPIVAGLRDDQMKFASIWSWEVAAKTPFPSRPVQPEVFQSNLAQAAPRYHRCRGFADEAKDRVIVAYSDTMFLVPVPPGLPGPEPGLMLAVVGDRSVLVGKTLNLRLSPSIPEANLELVKGPESMTLADGVLSWTPNDHQAGRASATVRLTGAGRSFEQEVAFEATYPVVELPFAPLRMATDPGGHSALLWGMNSPNFQQVSDQSDLAVVDLDAFRVLQSRKLPTPFSEAALDADRVYLGTSKVDMVLSLKRPELDSIERHFTRFPLLWLSRDFGSLLLAGKSQDGPSRGFPSTQTEVNLALEAATLKPAEVPAGFEPPAPLWMSPNVGMPWVRLKEGLMFNGVLFDTANEANKPRLLVSPPGYLWPWQPGNLAANTLYSPPSPWGRTIVNGQIETQTGQSIAAADTRTFDPSISVNLTPPLILSRHPISLTVVTTGQRSQNVEDRSTTVVARDLLFGSVVDTIKVAEFWYDQELEQSVMSTPLQLRELGDGSILLLERDRLYRITLDEKKLAEAPVPLGVVPTQTALVADPRGETRLSYVFRGGKSPREASLTYEIEGMTIAPETGEVTLKGPPLVAAALANLEKPFAEQRQAQDQLADDAFSALLDRQAKAFEALVGRAAQGVPVLVPISVRVVDAEGQYARLDHAIFLELPRDRVEQAYRKAKPATR